MYGQWSVNKKGDVVMCGFKCNKNHDHLVGNYERAMIYFTGSTEIANEEKHYGNLMNIIYTHQTNDRFITKTSSELYNILMNNASTKKYWIPEGQRHEKIVNLLIEAKKLRLIYDEEIIKSLKSMGNNATASQLRRIYRQEQFEKFKL